MTREEFAKRIHWHSIFWIIGFLNPLSMLPQLVSILRTRETSGVSIEMFVLFLVIQSAFAFEGYVKRMSAIMYCMIFSMIVSVTIISATLCYR